MGECVVIQPFDGGEFDQRYREVLKPAIEAAGLSAYRVDDDRGATIPVDDVEKHIRAAACCVADITEDRPNVWYEVGFAMAAETPLILVCSTERRSFPFDIHHRHVIRYRTGAPSDFEALKDDLTGRIKARVKAAERIRTIEGLPRSSDDGSLSVIEQAALMVVFEDAMSPEESTTVWSVEKGMAASGFNNRAARVGLLGLRRRGMILVHKDTDYNGNEYAAISPTEEGLSWLLENQSQFDLQTSRSHSQAALEPHDISDDDIPF